MYRELRRLVDDQQVRVLEKHRVFQLVEQAWRRLPAPFQSLLVPQWRNAHLVADLQLVFRLAALLVDAYLALANQAVDTRARDVAELFEKKIIDALIELRGRYFHQADRCFRWLI